MEKSLNTVLRQQMNVDDMPNLGDIPPLGERAKQLIASRKKDAACLPARQVGSSSMQSQSISFLDLIFSKYKMVSLSFCLIGIISAINFLMTINIDTGAGKIAGTSGVDTSLTVSSNTYLATLNQSTISEAPAHTSTALTSISTFKN
jgi:hypothetical protein